VEVPAGRGGQSQARSHPPGPHSFPAPEATLQPLHPEMVERVCGFPRRSSWRSPSSIAAPRAGRRRRHHLRLNLTQHTNGVQNIRPVHAPAPLSATIGRPGVGWCPARARQCPGSDRSRAALPRAAGYLAMPLRDAPSRSQDLSREGNAQGGFWVNRPSS
jgi:anaerobic selenocysteine-containing dehydrogenase